MPDRFVESHIRKLNLFNRLPAEHLKHVVDAFRVMRVEPGELVFQQGQPRKGLYMLVSGRAQLVRAAGNGPVTIEAEIFPNQYLGEDSLFQEGKETASLRVVESATILFLSRQRLLNVIAHHPEIKQLIPIPVQVAQSQVRTSVFRGQRENETVLLTTRRHWWLVVRRLWLPVLVAVVSLLLVSLIPEPTIALVMVFPALAVPGAIIAYIYIEWRNDHFIITDERIIRIEQVIHRFKRSISEVPLASIIEVNADNVTADPFSRLFDYGTVVIKTAGDAGNMDLTLMPRPDDVQDLIFENLVTAKREQEFEQRNTIRATVDKVLGGNSSLNAADQDENGHSQSSVEAQPSGFNLLRSKFTNDKGETVYRKHLIHYVRHAMLAGLAVLLSLGLMIFSFSPRALETFSLIGPIFSFFLLLVSVLWLYWVDWDWRNDLYIVGDDTIRIIHKRPLWLQNEQDQVLLTSVDNVVSDKSGLLQSLLDYGNVRLSLIGGDRGDEKFFRIVPRPQDIQSEITRRQARLKRRQQEQEERRRQEEIAEYLSVYHETVNNMGYQNAAQTVASANPSGEAAPPPRANVYDRMRPPKVPKMRRRGS